MELAENWNDKKLNLITGHFVERSHNGYNAKNIFWFTLKDLEK